MINVTSKWHWKRLSKIGKGSHCSIVGGGSAFLEVSGVKLEERGSQTWGVSKKAKARMRRDEGRYGEKWWRFMRMWHSGKRW
jgi:hypothetical protein